MAGPRRAGRVLRNIRQAIPTNTILGRRSPGDGPCEFIPLDEAQQAQLDDITTTPGSILYRGASAWAGLPPGSNGQVLKLVSGLPAWAEITGGQSQDMFGVNTTADATNRLAVKSDAVLFSHDDVTPGNDDCIVKVNKAAAGDTASHLFQTGFSGRAEFGLTGDDDFHLKVSADGSAWNEAIVIDKDNGFAGFGHSSPTAPVHVFRTGVGGTSGLDSVKFEVENAFNFVAYSYYRDAHTAASGSSFFTIQSARGTKAAPAALQSPDWVGGFAFQPYVAGTANAFANRAIINAEVDGTVSGDTVPVSLIFRTSSTSGFSDRMRIKADGKVGIGEATPGSLLHVDGGGVQVGNPTGGDKGTGAINAQAVYDDNTLLSCYVFDQALDGAIGEAKWDARVPDRTIPAEIEYRMSGEGEIEAIEIAPARVERREHAPMRLFAARAGTDYDPLTLDGYARHWKEKRHLTALPNEAAFDPVNGQLTAGEWVQRLVETVEIQAVLIEQLNERIKALEARPGRILTGPR